jgi:hypothetical protein
VCFHPDKRFIFPFSSKQPTTRPSPINFYNSTIVVIAFASLSAMPCYALFVVDDVLLAFSKKIINTQNGITIFFSSWKE